MNPARYESILSSQTNIARKVLEFVPLQEAWEPKQISSEMYRVQHTAPDKHILEGCLSALVEAGLVRELSGRRYQRFPPPDPQRAVARPILTAVKEPPMPAAAPQKADTLERLSGLATKLRAIADEIDDCALDVQAALDAAGEEHGKLSQLKKLLKGIVE